MSTQNSLRRQVWNIQKWTRLVNLIEGLSAKTSPDKFPLSLFLANILKDKMLLQEKLFQEFGITYFEDTKEETDTFLKKSEIQFPTKEGLTNLEPIISTISDIETLDAHKKSVLIRLGTRY